MNPILLIQNATEQTAELAEAVAENQMNYIDMAIKGGWIMIPLVLLSFVAVYIFFVKIFCHQKSSFGRFKLHE